MRIIKNTVRAEFIRRPNRFQAYVILDGEEMMVHVPNTGRCREILIPGSTVILREESNPLRKTKYDLIAGYKGDKLINIDSQIPNRVVEEALRLRNIDCLKRYELIEREKTYGNSRFDFRLQDMKDEVYYLEVKGVTLEANGAAKFPDAPTERGRKHLLELSEIAKGGGKGGVLFLMQMNDIKVFSPHDDMDPKFGEALRYAKACGVEVMSYQCEVGEDYITLSKEVEVLL